MSFIHQSRVWGYKAKLSAPLSYTPRALFGLCVLAAVYEAARALSLPQIDKSY